MSDDETLRVYGAKAQEYAELTSDDPNERPLRRAFIAALPKGAHVLDLGCGPGQTATVLAREGFRVTAMDAVPEMIAMAAQHEGVDARVATFDQIEGDAIYDGIWANFSLLHAPRADMPRHLAALRRAIKPGGIFHIALKSGTGETRDSLGRLYTYYSDAELSGLVTAAGFTITNRTSGSGIGLDGAPADWIALRAHA